TRSKRDWSSDVCSSDLMLMYRYFLILFRVIVFVFGNMPSYRVGGFNQIISQVLIPISCQGSILSRESSSVFGIALSRLFMHKLSYLERMAATPAEIT